MTAIFFQRVTMVPFSRRRFLSSSLVLTATALSGCASTHDIPLVGGLFSRDSEETIETPDYRAIYASFSGEKFPVEAFDYTKVDPRFLRQIVTYQGSERPGTIVVNPAARQLYFVEPGHRATRYGVGVGREGFGWSGHAQINMRRSWPDWIPPQAMVARDPEIRAQLERTPRGEGVPGGPRSPLGARALYLFADAGSSKMGDLGYRIHGTTEPETIGTDVSSGCIRMVNQDVIHLYSRAPEGTKVIVLG